MMKISELILELEKIKEKDGDLPIFNHIYHQPDNGDWRVVRGISEFFPQHINSLDGVKVVIG